MCVSELVIPMSLCYVVLCLPCWALADAICICANQMGALLGLLFPVLIGFFLPSPTFIFFLLRPYLEFNTPQ